MQSFSYKNLIIKLKPTTKKNVDQPPYSLPSINNISMHIIINGIK